MPMSFPEDVNLSAQEISKLYDELSSNPNIPIEELYPRYRMLLKAINDSTELDTNFKLLIKRLLDVSDLGRHFKSGMTDFYDRMADEGEEMVPPSEPTDPADYDFGTRSSDDFALTGGLTNVKIKENKKMRISKQALKEIIKEELEEAISGRREAPKSYARTQADRDYSWDMNRARERAAAKMAAAEQDELEARRNYVSPEQRAKVDAIVSKNRAKAHAKKAKSGLFYDGDPRFPRATKAMGFAEELIYKDAKKVIEALSDRQDQIPAEASKHIDALDEFANNLRAMYVRARSTLTMGKSEARWKGNQDLGAAYAKTKKQFDQLLDNIDTALKEVGIDPIGSLPMEHLDVFDPSNEKIRVTGNRVWADVAPFGLGQRMREASRYKKMRITKQTLKKMIKEELKQVLKENMGYEDMTPGSFVTIRVSNDGYETSIDPIGEAEANSIGDDGSEGFSRPYFLASAKIVKVAINRDNPDIDEDEDE